MNKDALINLSMYTQSVIKQTRLIVKKTIKIKKKYAACFYNGLKV